MNIRALIAKFFPEKPNLSLEQIREGMTRRRFLGMAGGAAIGVAVAPELFELLKPKSIIVLPEASIIIPAMARGNQLLTISLITNEALKVLSDTLRFSSPNHYYDGSSGLPYGMETNLENKDWDGTYQIVDPNERRKGIKVVVRAPNGLLA